MSASSLAQMILGSVVSFLHILPPFSSTETIDRLLICLSTTMGFIITFFDILFILVECLSRLAVIFAALPVYLARRCTSFAIFSALWLPIVAFFSFKTIFYEVLGCVVVVQAWREPLCAIQRKDAQTSLQSAFATNTHEKKAPEELVQLTRTFAVDELSVDVDTSLSASDGAITSPPSPTLTLCDGDDTLDWCVSEIKQFGSESDLDDDDLEEIRIFAFSTKPKLSHTPLPSPSPSWTGSMADLIQDQEPDFDLDLATPKHVNSDDDIYCRVPSFIPF